jgi:lipopolysaccharide/colanic/teichoic acid biosynthesis glycosyltransferase
VSTILLLLTLPVLAAVLCTSAVALRAWPLFTQDRVGRDGRVFRFLKVRTLPVSAPAYADKHHLDMSQVPPVCQAIRKLHLDEIPQLLLVLAGQMTLVGPRPEMPHLHERMAAEFARLRTSVRPGCTGLWQVSASCNDLILAAPEYDCFYLTHRSLRLDLWIIYRTALKMLGLGTAPDLTAIPAWTLGAAGPSVVATDPLGSAATGR